ncbi:hypothetical protein KIN20_023463 [Parelaphostrongylus tenuis]|uniref:Amino acid transporter n=1 Tax=Parelaphostrongylus tenuis TaxID=148309 RepID=A0AAD5QVV6_PARTN|nr:hypothetical protein KIN20_023463 [Parelaphostrongylus tenuis]
MAVAAIFIAQLNGVELSFLRVISVSFTVTLAAMCSAGVPSAGLILVLTSMGLPIGDVSLLLLADRILDRVRESINVVGNAFGAVIINHHVKEDLLAYDVLHANDFDLNGLIGNMKSKETGGPNGDKKAIKIDSSNLNNAPSMTTNAEASYAKDEISVEMPETVTNQANTGVPAYGTSSNTNYSKKL